MPVYRGMNRNKRTREVIMTRTRPLIVDLISNDEDQSGAQVISRDLLPSSGHKDLNLCSKWRFIIISTRELVNLMIFNW
jgi:hypothetical protein